MGKKTRIDWCDSTWNPVTGCFHECQYCYARRIAVRFGGASETHNNECCHECQWETEADGTIHVLEEPLYDPDMLRNAPYPFEFDPTFHRYRLDEPARWTKPRTIFVCSMADLFGDWVPDEWIQEVFKACEAAPQHRYLFLTKNPKRYLKLADRNMLPAKKNFFYGSSKTNSEMKAFSHPILKTFISVEPILEPVNLHPIFSTRIFPADWVIVGAETGNRKNKIIPKKEWIDEIAKTCRDSGTPIFMKESLRNLMGDDFRQEYPWEVQK